MAARGRNPVYVWPSLGYSVSMDNADLPGANPGVALPRGAAYRLSVLGGVGPALARALEGLGNQFTYALAKSSQELSGAVEIDALIVTGPPFPETRSAFLPAGTAIPVIGVLSDTASGTFTRVIDLALDDVLVGSFSVEELKYRLITRIAKSRADALRVTLGRGQAQVEKIASALDRADEHLRLIMESANDFAIFTTDLEGRVTFWSRGAEILFGYSALEMVGKTSDAIFTPEDLQAAAPQKEFETALRTGRSEDERWHLRKSGETFWASGFLMPLRDGNVRGFVKIVRDRTERKRLELRLEKAFAERTAELRAVNEQLDRYASYVAHDLRSPVKVILGLSEVMQERFATKLNAADLDLVERVGRSAERMNELITRLLIYSRTVTVPAPLEPVSLELMVQEAVAKHSALAKMHSATIEVEPPLPSVMGAPFLLAQVIDNLVGNGLKFHQRGRNPHLRIRAEQREGRVRLWVEDNGIGIDPEFHQRIFQPLQRLHTQEFYEGHGLGLSIAIKAVERMNGTLGVESQLNVGSKFWVELALAEEKRPVPNQKAEAAFR